MVEQVFQIIKNIEIKMEKEKKQEENFSVSRKSFGLGTVISSLLVLAFVGVSALVVAAYFSNGDSDGLFGRITNRISFPAAVIDGTGMVYVSSVRENMEALKRFYENQNFSNIGVRVDFSTEDGKKRLKIKEREVLNKSIEDKVIEILSLKRGIKVTDEDVTRIVSAKIEEYGTADDFDRNLREIYGWDLERFKVAIVKPALYSERLKESVMAEIGDDSQALDLIGKAKKELDAGKDFSETARAYSQGDSADEGGEIGWVTKEQLLPEIAERIFSADYVGGTSDVIASSLGYHIVRVEENKKEDGVDMVRIRQVFVRRNTFADWLGEEMKRMKFNILMYGYKWDDQAAVVVFDDEDMNNFQKEAYDNPDGDLSVIF